MIHVSSRRISRLGVLLLACSALSAVPASAQNTGEPKIVRFGTWGVDLGTRDMNVRPGEERGTVVTAVLPLTATDLTAVQGEPS